MNVLRKLSVVLIVCCLAGGAVPNAWSDIVKWVDENGDVHYGDRVPEKYKGKAEILEKDEVSVVGQDEDIKQQNKQYSNSLKQQDYAERQRKTRQQAEAQKESGSSTSSGVTKEDCRNRFPNNVKMRTKCFLDVSEKQ